MRWAGNLLGQYCRRGFRRARARGHPGVDGAADRSRTHHTNKYSKESR
jgi:hypothetical protein